MAARTNKPINIAWDIQPGALVKIRTFDYNGDAEYKYGIVVTEQRVDQVEMFPFVKVYNFNNQLITKQLPDSLEVISRPTDD